MNRYANGPRPRIGYASCAQPPLQSQRNPARSCQACQPCHLDAGTLLPLPLAMAYVPVQTWGETYDPETALCRGTLFPSLDLPFMRGGCR